MTFISLHYSPKNAITMCSASLSFIKFGNFNLPWLLIYGYEYPFWEALAGFFFYPFDSFRSWISLIFSSFSSYLCSVCLVFNLFPWVVPFYSLIVFIVFLANSPICSSLWTCSSSLLMTMRKKLKYVIVQNCLLQFYPVFTIRVFFPPPVLKVLVFHYLVGLEQCLPCVHLVTS